MPAGKSPSFVLFLSNWVSQERAGTTDQELDAAEAEGVTALQVVGQATRRGDDDVRLHRQVLALLHHICKTRQTSHTDLALLHIDRPGPASSYL